MNNDFEIEERINTLLSLIDNLQLDIFKLEARTISTTIEKKIKDKDRVLRQYWRDLNTLVNKNIDSIDTDLIKVISDNANLYLDNNLETYKKAFKKGVIKVNPVITKVNKEILANGIKSGQLILNRVLTDLKTNSNNKISGIIIRSLNKVNSGEAREKAITNAAKEVMEKGLSIKDNGGREWRDITAYIRMSVKSVGNKTFMAMQEQLAKDIGIPDKDRYIETSSHYGSRPEHAKWQGKVLKYTDFVRICMPGAITGIGGINCRHKYYDFIKGISKPAFKHYDEGEDKKRYEAQQHQRRIEANIRKYKQSLVIAENMGLDTTKYKTKIKEWQGMAREYTKKHNLLRRYEREKIA